MYANTYVCKYVPYRCKSIFNKKKNICEIIIVVVVDVVDVAVVVVVADGGVVVVAVVAVVDEDAVGHPIVLYFYL